MQNRNVSDMMGETENQRTERNRRRLKTNVETKRRKIHNVMKSKCCEELNDEK